MENNKTPEIRFTEFSDEWKEQKLCDVADFFDEQRIPVDSEQRKAGEYPYYGATGIIDYVDSYIFDGEYVLLAEDGANIIMRRSPIAYLTKGKFWLNNHAHIMRMKNGANNFLIQLLEIQNYQKYNSGTAQPKLNAQVVKGIIFKFPSLKEQTKIGNFFKKFDDIISLHQRELDNLKQMKQGFLQKMFPKEGESVPELRFPGFEDKWVQLKLSKVKDIRDGTHDSPKYYNFGHPLVTSKNLTEYGINMEDVSFISDADFKKINNRSKVDVGDIIFGMIGTIGNPVIIDKDNFAIKNVALIKRGGDIRNIFLIQLLKSPVWKKYICNENTGNSQKFISLSKIREFEFYCPSLKEQTKIGEFFKQLDTHINLHQQELDLLKQTKKAFLQKMFI